MNRCIMGCTGIALMAMVFMLGSAAVSSAEEKPVPPVAHHQNIENAPAGVFTPTTPPPTGAGKKYEGPGYIDFGLGSAKPSIQTPK